MHVCTECAFLIFSWWRFCRNWRRQTMTATWARSGQTDRPSKNSFKASPTSNGGRDEDHNHPDSHLGAAALTCSFTALHATDLRCLFRNPGISSLSMLFEVFQRILLYIQQMSSCALEFMCFWTELWRRHLDTFYDRPGNVVTWRLMNLNVFLYWLFSPCC